MKQVISGGALIVGSVIAGGLWAMMILVPQLVIAHRSEDETKAEYRELVAKCHVYVDGSAKCPPGTFKVKAAK